MNDRDFIKNFLKIKISDVCLEVGINPSNIYNGNASDEKFKKVREKLEEEIKKLYEIHS